MIENLTQKFLANPAYLDMGAGKLSNRWNCTKEEIYEAKENARDIMNTKQVFKLQEDINATGNCAKYVGSEITEDGQIKKFESAKPLSPKEIEELVSVDGINTSIARVWDKLLPNGVWTYSVDIRFKVKDFYTSQELADKLRKLMPDLTPTAIESGGHISDTALVICIADDHAGVVNITDNFDSPKMSYKDRLMTIVREAKKIGGGFSEVHIISLGDQMNGWNSQTTRGGHEVTSLSNKDQFDIYVEGRVAFYNALFTSGLGESYYVHDVENSNHSGLGMSYMANKALEFYLDGKFPQVVRESIHGMIGGFQYGKHVVLMGHGKDEKFQKRPMPSVLNPQTDLYLYDYAQNKGYSPYSDTITFYKGDLHQLGLQHGKFGRYVNVQSVAGNSDYGDINFGNTKGGALMEILDKDSYRVYSHAIWF